MSDPSEIFDLLGVEPGVLTINAVQISSWGGEVQLDCTYESRAFQLVFEDCRSIQWDVRGHPDERDTRADVIGLLLGEEEHHESAIVVTDTFELVILYGEMLLIKAW